MVQLNLKLTLIAACNSEVIWKIYQGTCELQAIVAIHEVWSCTWLTWLWCALKWNNLTCEVWYVYTAPYAASMVYLNLNLTEHVCSMGSKHFSFYTLASMHVPARLMTSNLSFNTLVYALNRFATVCRHTRACQECTYQIWITHACKL